MYRKRILALSIITVLLLTSSCGSTSTSSSVNQSVSASSGAISTDASSGTTTSATGKETTVTTSAAITSESTQAPAASSTQTFVPDQDLDAILDKVTNYEEGTAGSSLKQAKIAGELLDWTEDSSLKQKDSEAQIAYYLKSVGTAALVDQFTLHFGEISKTVILIIGKDSYTLSSLTDAGYTPSHSQYTQSKWDTFATAVQFELGAY